MQSSSYLSFYFGFSVSRSTRSCLLDRWSHSSLRSCVLRLGSQRVRGPWMRQILSQNQVYNMLPHLLRSWTDSLFPSGLEPLSYWDPYFSRFPLLAGCLCGLLLHLPPSCCELFDSRPLPDGTLIICSWVWGIAFRLPCWPGGWPGFAFLPALILLRTSQA